MMHRSLPNTLHSGDPILNSEVIQLLCDSIFIGTREPDVSYGDIKLGSAEPARRHRKGTLVLLLQAII